MRPQGIVTTSGDALQLKVGLGRMRHKPSANGANKQPEP